MLKRGFFVCTSVLLLIAGCSKEEQLVEPQEEPKKEVIVEEKPRYVAPLSGELVEEEVTQRPIMVTINNHPDARPQSGIGSADIVYEMVAEGNVTRFLAVFQSELPEAIGPVRSARDYFIEMAQGLDAFYVAHGYSPEAKQLLSSGVVDNINGMQYDGTLFYRSTDRYAPHNSYITSDNIKVGAEKIGASLLYNKKISQAFYNEEESVKIGTEAKRFDVRYGSNESFHSSYVYNKESNLYERSSGGIVTIDALTNEPIELANVLVLEMPQYTIDNYGRQSLDLKAGGKAYVFQNGYVHEVQWENHDGQLVAVNMDGSLVQLVAGKTWVHFVSTSPGIATSVKYQLE